MCVCAHLCAHSRFSASSVVVLCYVWLTLKRYPLLINAALSAGSPVSLPLFHFIHSFLFLFHTSHNLKLLQTQRIPDIKKRHAAFFFGSSLHLAANLYLLPKGEKKSFPTVVYSQRTLSQIFLVKRLHSLPSRNCVVMDTNNRNKDMITIKFANKTFFPAPMLFDNCHLSWSSCKQLSLFLSLSIIFFYQVTCPPMQTKHVCE